MPLPFVTSGSLLFRYKYRNNTTLAQKSRAIANKVHSVNPQGRKYDKKSYIPCTKAKWRNLIHCIFLLSFLLKDFAEEKENLVYLIGTAKDRASLLLDAISVSERLVSNYRDGTSHIFFLCIKKGEGSIFYGQIKDTYCPLYK